MTADPGAVTTLRTDTTVLELERLHVAARSVLEWLGETGNGRLDPTQAEHLRHHAEALLDAHGSPTPFAATRAHALRVRNELTLLATERSLTIAVWIDDALHLADHGPQMVTEDPLEGGG
ncbi:hypothetical protein [Actinomycetospora flava]|uniref:Uncharacterized protein n=1 Tax=Actinomycetospora flava TaxID=3129232 RepID=A0ABU8M8X2_9PSEU